MVESRRAWCGSARAGGKEKARSSTAGHVSPPTPMLDALIVIILAITILLLLPLPPPSSSSSSSNTPRPRWANACHVMSAAAAAANGCDACRGASSGAPPHTSERV
ncbi:hypothetical protein ACJBU6_00089 [Exserohilum turcicum]